MTIIPPQTWSGTTSHLASHAPVQVKLTTQKNQHVSLRLTADARSEQRSGKPMIWKFLASAPLIVGPVFVGYDRRQLGVMNLFKVPIGPPPFRFASV